MIKVNELRIRNIIGQIGTYRMSRVLSISQSEVMVGSGNDGETEWLAENKLMAVPLRPELLEKIGFKSSEDGSSHTIKTSGNLIMVLNCKDVFLSGYNSVSDGLSFHCTIKSLHQFQNLYFALTGIEPVVSP